ncbi:MAG: enoyl-CoA hydratase/isomerase family protein [Myxococcota bacterium]
MPIRTESRGAVGLLRLDRPDRAHAYDRAHLDALLAGATALAEAHRVLVLTSTGDKAFCGGADLDTFGGPLDALELRSQRVFTAIARLPVVTICAVHGAAVAGGFELTLACDLRVAGPAARF